MAETQQHKSVPFIEGASINLCPANTEHINLYAKWMNTPEIRKYARYVFPQIVEEVKRLFEPQKGAVKEYIFFEIWNKEDKKPIGYTGLTQIRWFDRSAFLFYMIGELEYWGKGIATDASKLVISYGFNELNLNKISARIFDPNKASIRIAEKIGLKRELTLKNEIYIDGTHVDSLNYSILKKEWKESDE
ncbi:MAG: GNAT family N-acetyltransferase [Promethearchaeota archaeon]|jgi:RimJ/RimL family protein N-acetyltransferase